MNSIHTIRLDLNAAKYHSATAKQRVTQVESVNTSTETDKKKQNKTQYIRDYEPQKEIVRTEANRKPNISSYNYRANLLNEIVDKMNGLEKKSSPGQFVEFYA